MKYVKSSYMYITLYGMVTWYTCKTFDRLYNIIFLIFLCQNSIILKLNHIVVRMFHKAQLYKFIILKEFTHTVMYSDNVIVYYLLWCKPIIQLKWTPLHYAANYDHSDTVALLVKNGADINMKNVVSLWWIISLNLLRSNIVVYKIYVE